MSGESTMSDSALDFLDPLDIIFSCGICHDSIRDIYSTSEANQGFRDDRQPGQDGVVNKFWLTQCGHLVCAKHIEDGAMPFHLAGEQPRAACPECVRTKDDPTHKRMFPIRGYKQNEHDPVIPMDFFQCPPMNLDGDKMDNLRFQYLSLVSYGTAIRTECRQTQRVVARTNEKLQEEIKEKNQVQTQLQQALQRLKELKPDMGRLQKWEQKKPMITHYLDAFPKMTKELRDLRNAVEQLGYEVSHTNYAYDPDSKTDAAHSQHENTAVNQEPLEDNGRGNTSSATMRGSSSDTLSEDHGRSSSLRKRAYDGDPAPPRERPTPVRGEILEAMPPPTLPVSKVLSSRHSGADQPDDSHPIRIQSAITATRPSSRQQFVDRHNPGRKYEPRAFNQSSRFEQTVNDHDIPLMSGALPVCDQFGRVGQNSFLGHESTTFTPNHGSNVHDTMEERLFSRPDIPTQIVRSPLKHDIQDPYADQSGQGTRHMQAYGRPPSEHALRQQARIDFPLRYLQTETSQPRRSDQLADFHSSGILSSARQNYARTCTPSPRNAFMRQTDSVASPFFKPMAALGPPESQENLYSQRMVQNTASQNADPGYRMAPVQGTPMLAPIARSINGLSFINEPHSVTGHEPLYERRDTGSYGYRPVSVAPPQTPRDGNGLFKRPGFAPEMRPFSSQQFRRPQPLPSSQPSLAPELYAAQSRGWPARNETLGLVKGAKGAGSSSSSSQRREHPVWYGSRSSGGGGRRSVRR